MSGRTSARKWLNKALQDLDAADRCMQPPRIPAVACFHAQQAAEKALKAVAISLGTRELPKTHDLLQIADTIERNGRSLPFAPEELASLNPYAVNARYPLPAEPSEAAAAAAVELARRIVQWSIGVIA